MAFPEDDRMRQKVSFCGAAIAIVCGPSCDFPGALARPQNEGAEACKRADTSRLRFGSRLLKINRYYDGTRGCGQEQSDDPIVALITHRCINQLASIPSIVRREALKRDVF
jgi:hypothetical protein